MILREPKLNKFVTEKYFDYINEARPDKLIKNGAMISNLIELSNDDEFEVELLAEK